MRNKKVGNLLIPHFFSYYYSYSVVLDFFNPVVSKLKECRVAKAYLLSNFLFLIPMRMSIFIQVDNFPATGATPCFLYSFSPELINKTCGNDTGG